MTPWVSIVCASLCVLNISLALFFQYRMNAADDKEWIAREDVQLALRKKRDGVE